MSITTAIILSASTFAAICALVSYYFCRTGSRADDEMEAEGASEGAFPATRFEEDIDHEHHRVLG